MSFPPLYSQWLESFLGAPIPEEPAATCLSCPMKEGEAAEMRFHPRTKCCTFFPELPNFSVGRLFLDDDPAMERGRELVRARFKIGQQVSPIGIGRPGAYYSIYGRRDTFGVVDTLKCPYYIDEGPGLCGVWRYREATCSTWFCKHERGRVGLEFWAAIRVLLKMIEDRLIFTTALELGINQGALEAVRATTATLYRDRDPDYYRGIWHPWAGRELEYYMECGRLVSKLDWDGLRARCGKALDGPMATAREVWEELKRGPRLPDLVRIRPFRRVGKEGDRTVLKTYSPFDSLSLPDVTVAALIQKESGSVAEMVEQLGPLGVDRKLLERMLDLNLLEPGDG